MANDTENQTAKQTSPQKQIDIPWRPVLLVGGLGLLGYAGYKLFGDLFKSPDLPMDPEDWAKWWEWEVIFLQDYRERITVDGREPSEEEWAQYRYMFKELAEKEIRAAEMGEPYIVKIIDTITGPGGFIDRWGLKGPIILVVGALALALINKYIKQNPRIPPNFKCDSCGKVFSSQKALEDHVNDVHTVTASQVDIMEAQAYFNNLPHYVQATIAQQAAEYANDAQVYDRVYDSWSQVATYVLIAIAIAAMLALAWWLVGGIVGGVAVPAAVRAIPALALV